MTLKKSSLPSNRSFGSLFSAISAGFGVYGYIKGLDQYIWFGWLIAGAIIGAITFLIPKLLTPFNKVWFLVGELLGKVVSPFVLGIIFFAVLTPVGLIAKTFGRDALRMKRREVSSYWIDRVPLGPSPETFKDQF